MDRMMKIKIGIGSIAVLLLVGFMLSFILEPKVESFRQALAQYDWSSKKNEKRWSSENGEGLPTVDTAENLYRLVKETVGTTNNRSFFGFGSAVDEAAEKEALSGSEPAFDGAVSDASEKQSLDYSGTNVQVQGVDEADVIKTDGHYLYQVQGNKVLISQIYPSSSLQLVETLSFKDKFYPTQLYLDDEYLVVIGGVHYPDFHIHNVQEDPKVSSSGVASSEPYPYYHHHEFTKAYVYNIKDVENVEFIREVEIEGYYLSSRKMDNSVYLLTNQSIHYRDENGNVKQDIPTPLYSDSAPEEKMYHPLDYEDIHYFPGGHFTNYLNVAGFNLDEIDQPLEVSSYLGAGENIYGSRNHLYVSLTNYDFSRTGKNERYTEIYKFAWEAGKVNYINKGEVPGHLLNQFSMDEHNGDLRVAVTSGDMWDERNVSKNHLFILDDQLEMIGSVEDLAPGERIYSVRFMGDRGYMVTFRTVDPLFVIDLKNPEAPQLLGELKIPGFSDYLHPYDEHHLIGFGKDTEEFTEKDWQGNVREMAIEKGMKMSIFDVSDVHHPKEKFVEFIGDRGTYSELLYNHKALLFSKDRNLLAFPVHVMEVKDKATQANRHPFDVQSEFVFQGAVIYHLDMDQGFVRRGGITHLTSNEMKHPYYPSDENFVQRIIYVNDTLYTISNGMLKANDLQSLEEIQTLQLPEVTYR